MKPDGVSGTGAEQKPTIIERIDSVNIKDTNQLSETLAGLREDAEQEIKNAFADNQITKTESKYLSFLMSRFCSLNGQIKTAMRNASDELKNLYEQLSQSLSATIDRLTKASNGKNPDAQAVVVSEPAETDDKRPKPTNLHEEIKEHSYELEKLWRSDQRGESNGAYKNFLAVMSLFRQGLYEKAHIKCESMLQLFGSGRVETGNVSIKMSKNQTEIIQNMSYALLRLCEESVDTNDKSEENNNNYSSNKHSDEFWKNYEATKIAATHKENDNFYRTMTGLEPPKK